MTAEFGWGKHIKMRDKEKGTRQNYSGSGGTPAWAEIQEIWGNIGGLLNEKYCEIKSVG